MAMRRAQPFTALPGMYGMPKRSRHSPAFSITPPAMLTISRAWSLPNSRSSSFSPTPLVRKGGHEMALFLMHGLVNARVKMLLRASSLAVASTNLSSSSERLSHFSAFGPRAAAVSEGMRVGMAGISVFGRKPLEVGDEGQ